MRQRMERRVRKQLRQLRGLYSGFAKTVAGMERSGAGLEEALRTLLLDGKTSQFDRGMAGRLMGGDVAVRALLGLFFAENDRDELYLTALALEELNDRRAVGPLIKALLGDSNPDRRRAAARALGWMRPGERRTARALAACLGDPKEMVAVREEAAESLSYVGTRATVPALVAALGDADVRVRFWAVFGLSGSGRGDIRAVRGLESVLGDSDTPPGNWWPVRLEALAALGGEALAAEVRRIVGDAGATEAERRWAEFYRLGEG